MGLFEQLGLMQNQQSALNAYYQQYARSLDNRFSGLSDGLHAHSVLDPGHSHPPSNTVAPQSGPDIKRVLEELRSAAAAPKNDIPDEVLLLLEV